MIELRRARAHKHQGQFEQFIEMARRVVARATSSAFGDRGQALLGQFAMRRAVYDKSPVQVPREDIGQVPVWRIPVTAPRVLAPQLNLEALALRRQALPALQRGEVAAARDQLQVAWQLALSAMYWAATMHGFENAQNYSFNLGLVQESLDRAGDPQGVVEAFTGYRLGLRFREQFNVGRDSAWDLIFTTNLWLEHPSRRREFGLILSFGELPIADPRLHLNALQEAQEIGEPRQIGYCSINLWRIARELACGDVATRHRDQGVSALKTLA